MSTIVYRSNAGTTKKYAELLASRTGCPCVELAEAKGSVDDDVVFLGWVMSNEIQGLAEAENQFELRAVAAVGMIDREEDIAAVREKANLSVPFFFLPGDFHAENLTGVMKLVMTMTRKMMKKEMKAKNDPAFAEFVEKIEQGVDKFDPAAIEPLAALLLNH